MIENVGGKLEDEFDEGLRYDAVLENFLEEDNKGVEDAVKRFYLQQDFEPLSSDLDMLNFQKNSSVKSVTWTYFPGEKLLKIRCQSLG